MDLVADTNGIAAITDPNAYNVTNWPAADSETPRPADSSGSKPAGIVSVKIAKKPDADNARRAPPGNRSRTSIPLMPASRARGAAAPQPARTSPCRPDQTPTPRPRGPTADTPTVKPWFSKFNAISAPIGPVPATTTSKPSSPSRSSVARDIRAFAFKGGGQHIGESNTCFSSQLSTADMSAGAPALREPRWLRPGRKSLPTETRMNRLRRTPGLGCLYVRDVPCHTTSTHHRPAGELWLDNAMGPARSGP